MTKAEKSNGAGQNFRSGRTAAGCANVQGIASIEALAAQRRPFQGCLLHRSNRPYSLISLWINWMIFSIA
jgi:hypothetical protein